MIMPRENKYPAKFKYLLVYEAVWAHISKTHSTEVVE